MSNPASSNTVEFSPGDFVIREKTASEAIFIISEGQLEVYKTGKDGAKVTVGIIGSGEYVGEAAMFLNTNHTSNVVALTKVTAIKLSRMSVEMQLKSVPAWLIALTRGLITRLHRSNEVIKKHGLTDESLASTVKAIEENAKKVS